MTKQKAEEAEKQQQQQIDQAVQQNCLDALNLVSKNYSNWLEQQEEKVIILMRKLLL
jgi:hypothetical protein